MKELVPARDSRNLEAWKFCNGAQIETVDYQTYHIGQKTPGSECPARVVFQELEEYIKSHLRFLSPAIAQAETVAVPLTTVS